MNHPMFPTSFFAKILFDELARKEYRGDNNTPHASHQNGAPGGFPFIEGCS